MSNPGFATARCANALRITILAIVVLSFVNSPASALQWIQRDLANNPGPRWGQKAVDDPATGKMFVTGGLLKGDEDEISDTTWVLNLSTSVPTWSVFTTGAPERADHTLILDRPRRRLVLFAGEEDDTLRNDSWVCHLDSAMWHPLGVTNPPCVREGHSAFFDSRHDKMMIHAGWVSGYGNESYDSWEVSLSSPGSWSNSTGSCIYTNPNSPIPCSPFLDSRYCDDLPTPRVFHAMEYDSLADYVLLDEGWYLGGSLGAEVWSTHAGYYGEGSWTQHANAAGLQHHTIVFDSARRRFIRFGGGTDDGFSNAVDTLSAVASTWGSLSASNAPSAREQQAAVYDPIYDRMVIYGGRTGSTTADDKVWELRFSDTPETAPSAPTLSHGSAQSDGRVPLTWTSTGADGGSGRATTYDVRASSTRIDSGNFGSATQLTGEPNPLEPGSAESYLVSGCGKVYFALKVIDAFGTASSMSNVDSVTFDSNGIRPAPPILVAEHEGGNHSAVVYVTPSGADSLIGKGAEYDLRRSLTTIANESDYASATQVSGEPAPSCSGGYDQINVSTLGNCKTYYFAVKMRDAYGNWSAMSNVDYVDTFCSGGFSDNPGIVPVVFELGTPRPNPTAGSSTISFGIAGDQAHKTLDLSIYDAAGRRVKSLRHELAVPGRYDTAWDRTRDNGTRASAGIYFVRLNVGGEQRTRTITLQ